MNNPIENDDFSDIESALRRLTPRSPSRACEARIAAALDAPAMRQNVFAFPRVIAWGGAAGLAIAACLVLALVSQAPVKSGGGSPANNAPDAPAVAATFAPRHGTAAGTPPSTAATAAGQPAPAVAAAAREGSRTIQSVEPLEVRRAPDGRFFQPYRVRYINTSLGAPANPSAAQPANPSAPVGTSEEEEIHFVGLDMI